MLIFDRIFKNSISKKTNENELGLTNALNTESLSGKINGLAIEPAGDYYTFLDTKYNDYYDLWNIYKTLEKTFVSMFEWDGLSKREARKVEELLFKNGKVALIKLPDGKLFITEFTNDNDYKTDNYGYPQEIKVLNPNNVLDGNKFTKNFAVIFNNSNHLPTLMLLWKRIYNLIKAIDKNDKATVNSDVKIPYSDATDSIKTDELNAKWDSNDTFIKVSNQWLKDQAINAIVLQDANASKQQTVLFHIDFILMFLGFKTQNLNMKAERQTELEVANNDKFNGLLIRNMLEAREEGSEVIKELLDLDIRPKEPEILQEKTEINGEENKNIMAGENND